MGLPKRDLIKKTTKEIFEKMTLEELEELDKGYDEQALKKYHSDLIETLKTNPTSIDFDVYGDMGEFLKKVRSGEYDAK